MTANNPKQDQLQVELDRLKADNRRLRQNYNIVARALNEIQQSVLAVPSMPMHLEDE